MGGRLLWALELSLASLQPPSAITPAVFCEAKGPVSITVVQDMQSQLANVGFVADEQPVELFASLQTMAADILSPRSNVDQVSTGWMQKWVEHATKAVFLSESERVAFEAAIGRSQSVQEHDEGDGGLDLLLAETRF